MKIRPPVTPVAPAAPALTRKDPKTDFTAEGAPPPGLVATTGPVGVQPRVRRKRQPLLPHP